MSTLFFDLETLPFGPYDMAPRPVCLSWADASGSGLILGKDIDAFLGPVLDGDRLIAGQSVAYDFCCLLEHHPRLRKAIWRAYAADRVTCTEMRERLLDIATIGYLREGAYSLEAIAKDRLGRQLDKGAESFRLRYAEVDGLPLDQWPEHARRYALDDSIVGLQAFDSQAETDAGIGYGMPTQFEEARAALALRLMGCWGIHVDGPRVNALALETERKMAELAGGLVAAGLARQINGKQIEIGGDVEPIRIQKDMAAIRAMVQGSYRGQVPLTDTGKVATDAETLKKCVLPELDALVEFNSLQKSGSTYVAKLQAGIGAPIHARWQAVGAASDRGMCREPNLMNQPTIPGVRECFEPRPGAVFDDCDFDSQEVRTLAQSCVDIVGSSRLARRYSEDPEFDPHLELAAQIGRIDIDEAKRRKDADDPEVIEWRKLAKPCSFGYPVGMGSAKFVVYARNYGVEVDQRQAKEMKALYLQTWPEMDGYFRHISSLVGGDRATVKIPQSGFWRAMCGYTDAANTYFQTLAAHASKAALFEVSRRCYDDETSPLYGCRPVLFVHDELCLEAPEHRAHEAAVELEKVMEAVQARWTPDVPASATACVSRVWSKNAKPVRDAGGRLVPWVP
jgi:hypothetical protein